MVVLGCVFYRCINFQHDAARGGLCFLSTRLYDAQKERLIWLTVVGDAVRFLYDLQYIMLHM
jgi:hypothetical protein